METGYLLQGYEDSETISLAKLNEETVFQPASTIKLFYAYAYLQIETLPKKIEINAEWLEEPGTNTLKFLKQDLPLKLSSTFLIKNMLANSCNASTKHLRKNISADQIKSSLDSIGASNTVVLDNIIPTTTLSDIGKLYASIYKSKPHLEFFASCTAQNRYYIFDQLKVTILTSKTGMIKDNDIYTVSNAGIFRKNDRNYFIAAYAKGPEISDCIYKLRELGISLTANL